MTSSIVRALSALALSAALVVPFGTASAQTPPPAVEMKRDGAPAAVPAASVPAAPAAPAAAPSPTPTAAPAPAPAQAPTPVQVAPAPVAPPSKPKPVVVVTKPDEVQQRLESWKVEVEQIASGIVREGQTDKHLAELRERAETIRAAASDLATAEMPRQASLDARLKQLGPAPQAKDDEPAPVETDAVKTEREEQQKLLAETDGRIKQAQLLALRAGEIVKTIADRRRDRFARVLVERSRSILDPSLWLEAIQSIPGTVNGLRYLIGDWFSLLAARGVETTLAVGSSLLALGAVLWGMRRRLTLLTERDPGLLEPPLLRKAAVAAGIVLVNLLVPVAGLWGTARALDLFDLNPDRISQTLDGLVLGLGFAAAIYGVALALLAPAKPQWRLAPVGDATALRLAGLAVVLSVMHGVAMTITHLGNVLAMNVSEVIAFSGLFAVVDAVVVMAALRTAAHSLSGEEDVPPLVAGGEEKPRSLVWRWIVPIGWLVAIAAVVSAVIGYVALAAFLSQQLVRSGFLLGALYILLLLIDEWILATFCEGTRIGTMLTRSMGFTRETVEQIGVVLSGIARLMLIAFAALLALTPVGLDSKDVVSDATVAFFGFKIGGFTFSMSTVLTAIVFLMLGIAVTRGIQSWLDERLLPRTRLDVGLKNSIRTSFGYIGYVLSVMLAFSVVGLNLQNLAIVAGALSVGIGFGLQSIVNNFVSGLILLAERPIKAGDLVEIGAEKGFVRKINVRSTEIETFDRASLIVPNSSLISGTVKNWMHRDLTGRCVVNVGVAYDADPEKVREVLLGCAAAHEKVLRFPAATTFFVNFGDSALEFRLVCTVANVNEAFGVESDLRFAIVAKLREMGIDIPYAQRDLHIRQLDDLRDVIGALVAKP